MHCTVVKQVITQLIVSVKAVSGDCQCQAGCGFCRWWTCIVHTASGWTVRDASEKDCVALTGTQRIETCLKGWGIEFYFLTAEWPFSSQGRTRQRWISQSSAFLSPAPPTELRINAPCCLSAEQGHSCWTASPSTQGRDTLQVCLLMRTSAINTQLCISATGVWVVFVICIATAVEASMILRTGQDRRQLSVFGVSSLPSSHLRRTAVHKYVQHDSARPPADV